MRLPVTRALVLLAAAAVLAGAGPAAAYPDAKVEARITPNFGALLNPPVSHPAKRRYGRWTPPGPPRAADVRFRHSVSHPCERFREAIPGGSALLYVVRRLHFPRA